MREDRSSFRGVAGRVRPESADRFGGIGRIVLELACQPEQIGGVFRKFGTGAVVDQTKPALDGAKEVVGRAELRMNVCGDDPGALERLERLPEVRADEVWLDPLRGSA